MISRLSIVLDKKSILDFRKDIIIPDELTASDRVLPKDTVQVLIQGKLVDASWGLIPSSAQNDLQQLNRIGVLTKDISHSSTYRLIARRNRGLIWARAFFHNTIKAGVRTRHRFSLPDDAQFSIPIIYDKWQEEGTDKSKMTFSLLHQYTDTSDPRIPSIVPVIMNNKSQMNNWLDVENRLNDLNWPDFDPSLFFIHSHEMDLKMRPSFKAIYPSDEIPDYLNNIA